MAWIISVAHVAQLSSLLPVIWMVLWSFLTGKYKEEVLYRQERSIEANLVRKRRRKISIWKDQMAWWWTDEALTGWGKRTEWLFGIVWFLWLGLLAAHSSNREYIRLVRHLGVMAVSQMPTVTLLAMKSHWSPFQAFLKVSHEELDPYHRILGRIVVIMATMHGCLYIQCFASHNVKPHPDKVYIVLVGITAAFALWVMAIFTISRVRNYSYRLFYGFHHAMFVVIMLALFIHVAVARQFVLESLFLYILNQVLRRANTKLFPAELSLETKSNILSISMDVVVEYADYPAGSIVNIASGKRQWLQRICSGFSSNPFTTAYDGSTGKLTAYLKTRGKRTLALSKLPKQTILSVEGPYGRASTYEETLPGYLISNTNRVLLVAGGVGATFAFAVALGILGRLQRNSVKKVRDFLKVVWIVRDKDDIAWAEAIMQKDSKFADRAILADVLTVYYSRPSWQDAAAVPEPDLSDLIDDDFGEDQPLKPLKKEEDDLDTTYDGKPQLGRPSLKEVVGEFIGDMSPEQTAAIAVCGPATLRNDLRQAVTYHIKRGIKVWWHEEKFGK